MTILDRGIRKRVIVPAPREQVWNVWTTVEGITSFFAPAARLEFRIGGPFEMLFLLDAEPGEQGSEGCHLLSYLPYEMLSYSWNAPPQYPDVRKERTWVVVQFAARPEGHTEVELAHVGWQEGEEWEQVYAYFERAWDVVLGRLVQRFRTGPIDWSQL